MSTTRTPFVLTTPTRADDLETPGYDIPDGLEHLTTALLGAYVDGVAAARVAATWTTNGNGDAQAYARILRQLDAGDPAAWDHLPETPSLSGEWADGPSVQDLVRYHLPDDVESDAPAHGPDSLETVADVLADAWEAGVSAMFSQAVEAELIAALPDPTDQASELVERAYDVSDWTLVDARDQALADVEALADVSDVERAGLVQAVHLEALRRAGVDVRISEYGVHVRATGPALYAWARGNYPNPTGGKWPVSALARDDVEGLTVDLARNGDLVDIDHPGTDELDASELNAFLCDVLADVLPIDHGAWWTNVGRHLDTDDPRRIAADRLQVQGPDQA